MQTQQNPNPSLLDRITSVFTPKRDAAAKRIASAEDAVAEAEKALRSRKVEAADAQAALSTAVAAFDVDASTDAAKRMREARADAGDQAARIKHAESQLTKAQTELATAHREAKSARLAELDAALAAHAEQLETVFVEAEGTVPTLVNAIREMQALDTAHRVGLDEREQLAASIEGRPVNREAPRRVAIGFGSRCAPGALKDRLRRHAQALAADEPREPKSEQQRALGLPGAPTPAEILAGLLE